MNPIDKVIFLLIKAGKPELCLSIMHLCPDIRRRGGFFQRRAEGKEQVYGRQDLVLGALGPPLSSETTLDGFSMEANPILCSLMIGSSVPVVDFV